MRLCLSVLLLTAFSAGTSAETSTPCPTSGVVQQTGDLAALPVPIAASLNDHVPNLSPPGSRFNGGDALGPGQTRVDRRLIAAFHHTNRWVVAYEAAGIAYRDIVVAYDLSESGGNAAIVSKTQVSPSAVCEAVTEALMSKSGTIDRYW